MRPTSRSRPRGQRFRKLSSPRLCSRPRQPGSTPFTTPMIRQQHPPLLIRLRRQGVGEAGAETQAVWLARKRKPTLRKCSSSKTTCARSRRRSSFAARCSLKVQALNTTKPSRRSLDSWRRVNREWLIWWRLGCKECWTRRFSARRFRSTTTFTKRSKRNGTEPRSQSNQQRKRQTLLLLLAAAVAVATYSTWVAVGAQPRLFLLAATRTRSHLDGARREEAGVGPGMRAEGQPPKTCLGSLQSPRAAQPLLRSPRLRLALGLGLRRLLQPRPPLPPHNPLTCFLVRRRHPLPPLRPLPPLPPLLLIRLLQCCPTPFRSQQRSLLLHLPWWLRRRQALRCRRTLSRMHPRAWRLQGFRRHVQLARQSMPPP
mmetsp:Transcript_35623/g.70626  ORF Transcript_35623/g.70626 Transcript_35623/m.70626 type:complete len:371 (-) Transcript_35623:464-1576(-)